jgi:antitoxin ParD1/3/4
MSEIHKFTVDLTGDQVAALEDAVEKGEYATTADIIREALRDWQFRRELRNDDIERLRELWDEGIASGPPEPLDFEDLRTEARNRLASAKKPSHAG